MLRILLPPNLASSAPRDAIATKVEIDLSRPPPAELLPGLAALQRLGAKPAPTLFLQLSRAQMRELAGSLRGQSVFFWVNDPARPILWVGHLLRGVSEHISEPSEPKPAVPTTPNPAARAPVAARSSSTAPRPTVAPMIVDGSEHFLAITLPSREHASYAGALELLKSNGFTLEPSNRKWWLRDRHRVLNFLSSHRALLSADFRADFTENFEKNTAHLKTTEIAVDAVEARDGYTLTLGLRAGRASETQIQAAIASNRGYIEDQGKIFLIDPSQLKKLGEAQRALSSEGGAFGSAAHRVHRLTSARLAEAQDVLEQIAPHFQPPETWRSRSEALRNLSQLVPAPLGEPLASLLRPYQKIGVAWLWHLYRNELGGVLADEMGLGKTLQALGLLTAVHAQEQRGRGKPRPSLVVCPASLLENWRREAARFAPELRASVHHGNRRLASAAAFADAELIITSYGTLVRDRELMGTVEFACVIADEAQHIKNRRSQNAQALRSLQSQGRCLLTGTPLENSLEDLRSLFDFLMPGYLQPLPSGVRGDERGWYDERLRVQTAKYILRRTKAAVAPELPAKIEQVIWCEMTPAQQARYRAMQEETERALLELETKGASENALRMATLTQLLRLRQICCDPRLVGPAAEPAEKGSFGDSAKLEAFRELLAEALDDGHRLLVFSQFTSLLSLLREELEQQEIPYAYLDGSMATRQRQGEVDRFQKSGDIPVFLLSLKAGGTGLNLTAADTVVHFDPWWNPAVEAQATDRAHRIGQQRVVTSYKLVCSGSVEEKVLALQEEKRALLADVFEASDALSAKLTLSDLRSLLV